MPRYKIPGKKKDGLQAYRVEVSYTTPSGEHKKAVRTAYGADAAKAIEEQLRAEMADAASSERITVAELAELYMSAHETDIRASSADKMRRDLRGHVVPHIGDVRLDKLTAAKLTEWKKAVQDEGLKLKTKQTIYGTLRAMLRWAVQMGYLRESPLKNVKNFRDAYLETETVKIRYYTADQFRAYMGAAFEDAKITDDWRFYTFFAIAFYAGLRKGENNALEWTDIDGDVMHVRRSVAQKLKGGDVETPPKNKSSIRDLIIPEPLMQVLADQRARQERMRGFSTSWRVAGGESVLRDSTIEHKNAKYAEKAGLPHISIHEFRHSHASLLANAGINIQEIARRLGHADVETTWKTYSHMYPREEERAITALNAVKL